MARNPKATPKPQKPTQTQAAAQTTPTQTGFIRDTLDMAQLRQVSQRLFTILGENPEVRGVFERAFAGGYQGPNGKQQFWNDLDQTEFWKQNSQDVREYIIYSANPNDPDFQVRQNQARAAVMARAVDIGAPTDPASIDKIAEEYLMFGWGKQANAYLLDRRLGQLMEGGEAGGGTYQDTVTKLRQAADANGVTFDDGWFDSAGISVATGFSTASFWENKIRENAASMFPAFKDQIDAGMSMERIASPYMNLMNEYWEVNPYEIKLNDPTLLKGMSGYDDKGNPKVMNLGEFAQMLRDDPRYMNTRKAKNEVADFGQKVLEMFGIVGGTK